MFLDLNEAHETHLRTVQNVLVNEATMQNHCLGLRAFPLLMQTDESRQKRTTSKKKRPHHLFSD